MPVRSCATNARGRVTRLVRVYTQRPEPEGRRGFGAQLAAVESFRAPPGVFRKNTVERECPREVAVRQIK